ncbi:hypothetical protein fugu_006018 [Takifugu bimaculatus]|uniref:Uncharacterized protein n=1 Tax=Takifugu bimaculatus TaxID=433685 RepID=A0A4Z2B6S3_9TELE|nr:hypothetical protein fugu_006018 [Takifugu bimaculatus]
MTAEHHAASCLDSHGTSSTCAGHRFPSIDIRPPAPGDITADSWQRLQPARKIHHSPHEGRLLVPCERSDGERKASDLDTVPLSPEMKLQAVMENLHRQQRAKLLMEQQLQQQAAAQHTQIHASRGGGD